MADPPIRAHGFAIIVRQGLWISAGFSLLMLSHMAVPMSLLRADAFLSPLEIEAAVTRALEEDLGRAGDITSIATVPEDTRGRAVLAARQAGVIAGLPLVAAAFRRLSPRDRDRAACARRRGDQGRHQADDDFRQCARHSRRRARRAQFPRPSFRHRDRDRRPSRSASRIPRRASSARARPRPGCARWRNTRCAAAAASITASASTTRS